MKLKRESRLGFVVHTDDLKARAVIPHGCPANTAEEIKQSWVTAVEHLALSLTIG